MGKTHELPLRQRFRQRELNSHIPLRVRHQMRKEKSRLSKVFTDNRMVKVLRRHRWLFLYFHHIFRHHHRIILHRGTLLVGNPHSPTLQHLHSTANAQIAVVLKTPQLVILTVICSSTGRPPCQRERREHIMVGAIRPCRWDKTAEVQTEIPVVRKDASQPHPHDCHSSPSPSKSTAPAAQAATCRGKKPTPTSVSSRDEPVQIVSPFGRIVRYVHKRCPLQCPHPTLSDVADEDASSFRLSHPPVGQANPFRYIHYI